MPWANASRRELEFDHGLDAQPRRRPHIGWTDAEALAGLTLGRSSVVVPRTRRGADAALVIETIKLLEPATAALVIANGRAGSRPDWLPGIVPRQVPVRKRCRKRHRKVAALVWAPCDPSAIRAARDAYRRWHRGVALVMERLDHGLEGWEIRGFAAPGEPWLTTA